jgi:hypothetical protein
MNPPLKRDRLVAGLAQTVQHALLLGVSERHRVGQVECAA